MRSKAAKRVGAALVALFCFSSSLRAEGDRERAFLYQWTPTIGEAIQNATSAPCLASRNLAIIYASAFDAVNSVDLAYEPYLENLRPPRSEIHPETASLAALSFAAETLFFSNRASIRALREQQMAWLREALGEALWARSVNYGHSVATALLDARADDGSTSTQTYFPKDETGTWRRTPPRFRPPELSHWGRTRPFAIERPDQFRLPPPPALESKAYADAFKQVRQLGAKNSRARTADQTEIAEFWSCFSYTSTPAGHWYEIATDIARKEGLSYLESARLLALINIAMADAGIAGWDTKYAYEAWRPIHAIRQADEDGNPHTQADPTWDSLLESPPHPEYISGHGAFSGAGGRIMELFFNAEDGYAFSTTSSSLPGVVRHYQSFAECTDEICMSRVYGGIHFEYSNFLGRDLGEQVADYTFARVLQPAR